MVNFGYFVGIHGLMLGKSIGSGTIIDPDGTILTCAHVVVDFQSTRGVSKGKVGILTKSFPSIEHFKYVMIYYRYIFFTYPFCVIC